MKTHKPKQAFKKHSNYVAKQRTMPLGSSRWKALRERVLSTNPLCEYCLKEGRITPATVVDHFDNNGNNNDLSNLFACCATCHSKKTAGLDMGHGYKYGCDAYGMPLDPEHEWFKRPESPVTEAGTPTPRLNTHFGDI